MNIDITPIACVRQPRRSSRHPTQTPEVPVKKLLGSLMLASLFVAAPALADNIPETANQDTSGIYPAGLDSKLVTGKDDAIVERIVTWTDAEGHYTAVFASTSKTGQKGDSTFYSKVLYVTTFLKKDSGWKKVQAIKEAVQPCDLDMTARFIEGSVEVQNLDEDGDGELTFGYVTRCAGDVSPLSMKLLTLEKDKKYILRGETVVDVGNGELVGGSYKADFGKAPKVLLDHAKVVWERLKTTGF